MTPQAPMQYRLDEIQRRNNLKNVEPELCRYTICDILEGFSPAMYITVPAVAR